MWSAASIPEPARRPVRFVLVGAANSLAGLAAIYFCKLGLGLGDVAANILGYAFGLVLSFALNSTWTFEYRGAVLPAAMRFGAAFLAAYAANLALVLLLIDLWHVDGYVAHAAGIVPYTVLFYALSRAFVFRTRA